MKKTIRDYQLDNKIVIIRCDFNVPIKNGLITDDSRIKKSLLTINYALNNNAKVLLLSHLGRIKKIEDKEANTLKPVAQRLANLLKEDIVFIPSTRKDKLRNIIEEDSNHRVFMLENTRWEDLEHKLESNNDKSLAKYWSSLGDIFINDAFGTSHRSHASNVGIASLLPSGIGFLVESELNALSILKKPERPFIAVLGGSKVTDKIKLLNQIGETADKILIGGAMAFSFLKYQNINIGKNYVDEESLNIVKTIIQKYKDKIILPIDFLTSTSLEEKDIIGYKKLDDLDENDLGIDIGPKTVSLFSTCLKNAKLVFFNGPLGVYEIEKAIIGTSEVIKASISSKAKVILGGGDIVSAYNNLNILSDLYHISTGGGATLEYISNEKLPAIDIISDK